MISIKFKCNSIETSTWDFFRVQFFVIFVIFNLSDCKLFDFYYQKLKFSHQGTIKGTLSMTVVSLRILREFEGRPNSGGFFRDGGIFH